MLVMKVWCCVLTAASICISSYSFIIFVSTNVIQFERENSVFKLGINAGENGDRGGSGLIMQARENQSTLDYNFPILLNDLYRPPISCYWLLLECVRQLP